MFDSIYTPGAYHVPADDPDAPLYRVHRSSRMDTSGVLRGFHSQSGHFLDPKLGADGNLTAYLDWLRAHHGSAVLWFAASLRYFSRHQVPGVVFLIRRPVATWLSFTAPHRHVAQFDRWGGRENDAALRVWCRWWNSLGTEWSALTDAGLAPVLLRYETALADAPPDLAPMFAPGSGWVARARDENEAPDHAREVIRNLTGAVGERVYR